MRLLSTLTAGVPLAAALLACTSFTSSHAATGAGELSMDRAAVAALIDVAIPDTYVYNVPNLGDLTFQMKPKGDVTMGPEGIRTTIAVSAPKLGLTGDMIVLLGTRLDKEKGQLLLETREARFDSPMGIIPDIASFIPVTEIPRVFDYVIVQNPDEPTRIVIYLQDVKITEERLTILLGMRTSPITPAIAD